jgi:membrane protease YdiL (CAAX protease family)
VTLVFLFFFVLYLLHALAANRAEVDGAPRAPSRLTLLLQSPLFFSALYLGYHEGLLSRDLVSPLSIGGGLLLGHLFFGLSLLITHRELRDASEHVLDWGALWRFLVENPSLLFRFLAVSITEELIYRVAAQPLFTAWTGSALVGIGLVAVVFAVIHWHFFRNPVIQSAEFLGFAILLGVLYHWTGSFSLVVTIHTVRNLEIVYLEYLVKLSELGDEEQAMREVEAQYVRHGAESR